MQVRTKAVLAGLLAVVVYMGAGVLVGWFVTTRIDHHVGPIVIISVPSMQLLLAPLLYLGVRSLVARNTAFQTTTYSNERMRIDGRDQNVSRATGTASIVISPKAGKIMIAIALGVFAIASLLLYANRNVIG